MKTDESIATGYEPPALVVLGPIDELTLGDGGSYSGDASATYINGGSDARLKREIRQLTDALAGLRRVR